MRLALVLMCSLTACSAFSEFTTGDNEVFRGTVLGQRCTPEPCSFIRRGFPADLVMDMSFDAKRVATAPGTLTTSEGSCGQFFDGDALLPIAPLAHDDLSLFEFPGAKLQNYIFAIRPSAGPLAGRDITAFVSLRDDEGVELRLLAGGGEDECQPTDCDAFARNECSIFGVFRLEKTEL